MAIDAAIEAIFGAPPDGLDLASEQVTRYNIVMSCILALSVAIVILRIYVRISKSSLWYDDYVVIASIFFCGATIATAVIAGKRGAGEHVWSTTIDRFISLLKVVYAEPYVYALAVTSTKVSVLLLYRRIFHVKSGGASVIFKYMFRIAVFMTGSYPLILWITMATACRPVSFYWNQYIGAQGSCINVELFFLVLGIVNMVNDIIILMVPLPVILSLNMNGAMKVSVTGIMMLGSIVCIASIFRIYYLNGLFKNVDATWWMGPSFAWSSIEPLVAIVAACLPTLAPLFRAIRTKTSGADSGPSNPRSGNQQGSHRVLASGSRSNGHYRMDDDEIELAYAVEAGGNSAPATTERSKDGGSSDGEDDHRIRIWTQVSVVSHDKP